MATSPHGSDRSRFEDQKPTFVERIKHFVFGKPKNLEDRSIFHRLSLILFLAGWASERMDLFCYQAPLPLCS